MNKNEMDNLIDGIIDYSDIMENPGWHDDSYTYEEDKENIKRYIREDLFDKPWKDGGLNAIPKNVVLFRVVFLKNWSALEEGCNITSLGQHWTYSKETIDVDTLECINNPEKGKKPLVIKAVRYNIPSDSEISLCILV